MKVAVIGANGQLGHDVCAQFTKQGAEVHPLGHAEIEIGSADSVNAVLEKIQPEVIVNTAAMHQVDQCELHPDKAFLVNGIGSRNLALAAKKLGSKLVHVSTDYVFDGKKKTPYVETDNCLPLNVYGNTKLSGENFVQAIADKHYVVRVSGLYGKEPCRAKGGLNFVRLMLKLAREKGTVKVVADEYVTPTYTSDASAQIVKLVSTEHYGVFHCTPQGQCSWNEFAAAIFRHSQTKVELLSATSADFPAKIPRPAYSVLDNRHLRGCGIDQMPGWEESLRRYLAEIGELRA